MDTFVHDLRLAVRNLLRTPGFTLVAALTLAIGIGANTAVFSIVDAILPRPLAFREPQQLIRLYETESQPGKYPFAVPGANRGRVVGGILGEGARLALIGFAAGLAGSLAAARIMASVLHDVQPRDPAVLALTAGLLAVVALAACYLPARRAAKVDPMRALRYE